MAGMPPSAGIELTNYCNLHCPECASGSGSMDRDRGYMDIGLFKKILNELKPYLYNINLFFQGEPMMHPDFFLFLEACKLTNSVVSTNGHFLSYSNACKLADSGLKKLIISIDGMDQNTYSAYRAGGQLSTVLEGIRNMSEAILERDSSLKLELQFLVNSKNEYQIPALKLLTKEVNAIYKLKSMQILNSCDIEKWLPVKERFRRYKQNGTSYILKSSLPDRCFRLWTNPVITWDGKVLPCCFDKNADHVMGDMNVNTFREIWEGEKYSLFRKSVINKRNTIAVCRNCTSGIKGVIV